MNSAALRIDRLEAWVERRDEQVRQEWRKRLIASFVGHLVVAAIVIGWPPPSPLPMPPVVTVNLLAAAPRVAMRPASAARAPAPRPAPVVAAPVQTKKVLPREAPKVSEKPAPEPPREVPPEPVLDYDAALSALRKEAGEDTPRPDAEQIVDEAAESAGRGQLNPELAAWQTAVDRRIKQTWVVPAEFRNISLRTLLSAQIMGDGTVLGSPRVKRSSGNPSYDDNAVRAIIQASPLPPPPRAGAWPIWFDG
ncbi:MAG: energy transducer TonB [Myxococcota bacterium]|nr:energy transducer TonB [Myxococcota bacterium]